MTKSERRAIYAEMLRIQRELAVLSLTLGERSFVENDHAKYLRGIHSSLFFRLFVDSENWFATVQMERMLDEAA